MFVNLESCVTLIFVLATFYMSDGQGHSCDMNSRPHPQGLCGARLSRAHSNLCFLLSQAYPNHFPGKRSVDGRHVLDKIYSIPLSVLAELDVSPDNWDIFFNKRENNFGFLHRFVHSRDDTEQSIADSQRELSKMSDLKRTVLQIVKKDEERTKRSVSHSSMVCDCCYNVCSPRHLATYC